MRCVLLALVTLAIVVGPTQAAEEAEEAPAVTESQAIGIGRVVAVLNSETAIDVTAIPLNTICRDLGTEHKIKIVIDEPALKAAGITLNAPVTLHVKRLSLRDSLLKVLDPLGLTYKIRPDGLLITTRPG